MALIRFCLAPASDLAKIPELEKSLSMALIRFCLAPASRASDDLACVGAQIH
jgi:hypothetical protein